MFTGLGNLMTIYLYFNDISDIQDGTFSSTPEMRELYLQHNKLKRLRADMFTGLGKLEILRLYANDISDIRAGTFSSMLQLKVLYLYNNKLKSLRPDMFTGLGNLQELHLQNNEITDIYLGTFSPMPNVNRVQLFANRITIFPFEYLSDIQTLSSLYLDNNQMTTLPPVAYDVLSSIADVQIHNNHWQCDCRMVEFRLKMTKSSSFDEPITCSQPDNLSGRNLIDVNLKDLMTDCQKPNITRFARIGKYPLIQGMTLRLFCNASGIPTPEITVELPSGLEHKATEESGGRVTVLANGTIIVKEVTAQDSGQYACIAANSIDSTKAYFSAVISPKFLVPSFPLPILNILYLIAAVAGTLVVVAIVLAIWCKCCRKDRSVAVGPDSGVVVLNTSPPAVMYSGHGARVAWGHPMAMARV
ncbi:PREDICTED: leucine-rich repeat-containing protein 4C-like [Branchiostoma belcheri]|uniref:Leucine-rich repeat-containing protein 4C-like n=1 Tax=Branchiostoma belcheri TaxID=7741 RepID=A0A6P4YPJ1_BRABE|nr:PREDICTED: leucine-rich repeat-containing protein 4C-like [Branchiostoma belcheri]